MLKLKIKKKEINRYENINVKNDIKKDDKYGEWFGKHSSNKIGEVKNQSESFETFW